MFGPNVTIATPVHPLLIEQRRLRARADGSMYDYEYAKPIVIGDGVSSPQSDELYAAHSLRARILIAVSSSSEGSYSLPAIILSYSLMSHLCNLI